MAYVPAPGYQPTYNPTLPFKRPIPGGLSVGMSVYIQGMAKENMRRFHVNFAVGQDDGADVAFHFNPRFDGWDKVVFNTMQSRQWGKEEEKKSMPFQKGKHFELVFMVMPEHYKVVVNGSSFYEYGHRLPVQMVTHLQVDGDLELQSINFLGGQPAETSYPVMTGPPVFNPRLPYVGALHGGLTVGRTIIIKGYVLPTARTFGINFRVGSSDDIALHINPRIGDCLVRNSYMNGSWGAEERMVAYNPFGPGQFFDGTLGVKAVTQELRQISKLLET
ncbi:galectin-6-like [Mus caroli]|uniref:Galectin n=1 Tax=Mus caroli TaxID=10089 RepID=A0A6P5PXR5_MUSCR|nr:galectin-6-like [Mus caroli]